MRFCYTVVAFLLVASLAIPQTAPTPRFEVASVKYDQRTAGSWVKQLIQIAYRLEDYQVSGGPGWLTTDWYDIEAKAGDTNAGRPEMTVMLQSLLAERFKLQLRHETKDVAVYELVIDKGGPKLTALKEGETSRCGRDNSFMCGIRTTAQLANSLKHLVGRPVIDKTGIDGRYDVLLDFDAYSSRGETPPPGYDKPSVFKAVQDQLGLRLEPQKMSLPALVIESIQRPTEN